MFLLVFAEDFLHHRAVEYWDITIHVGVFLCAGGYNLSNIIINSFNTIFLTFILLFFLITT
jgi:hypothetical protein